jgi:hypothetical protein
MFGWLFHPACPCDPAAKTWVEDRLEWLHDEFDDSAFTGRRIVLPTNQFFPDPYDGSKKSVLALLDRVCGYMDVDPDRIQLKLVSGTGRIDLVNQDGLAVADGAAGTYQEEDDHFIIRIDKSGLHNPMEVVGTLAHELAHARLLGESRIMSEIFDNELLTDLTVVHFGLGIFLANAPRNWDSNYSRWPGTKLSKPEYMTPPMFGWALAHLAWFRGEERPEWARYLTPGARANLKEGIRYLLATSDSAYKPVRLRRRG